MLERKNIIKLLSERTKGNVYHSAILTCYNFDSIFFESVYLPSLRSLGITNVIVLMDAGMYDNMLSDSSYVCHSVSPVNYTLVRQENTHHGVFHSKVTLLFGEEEGALIIGSGNLTFSGLSNNEEVWNAFHVAGNESVHYPLLLRMWNYIQDILLDSSSLVGKQLGWITEQSHWLQNEKYADWVTLETGEKCAVLYNSDESRILDKVSEYIGNAVVDEITVIAPFYDTEGNALRNLKIRFSPNQMNCVLDLERQSAPFDILKSDTDIAFFKYSGFNPLHAKIIEFQSDNGTWLLSGSANAGNMALGLTNKAFNDEVCVLIHSAERKNYIEELGVQYDFLTDDERESINRPIQSSSEPSTIITTLKACEEKDGTIFLHFVQSGINGVAVILDKSLTAIYKQEVVTDKTVEILIDDSLLGKSHMVVLMHNGTNISNRCLLIKEMNVECCNPDPKRRKLSSLLDDEGLLQNLNHILGYIEFDENDKKHKSVSLTANVSTSKSKEDVVVLQDRFNELKDSYLSISMHSGVRILAYLQQILFKKEDAEKSDDDLLEIDKDENGNDNKNTSTDNLQNVEVSSVANDANKMRTEIVNFLKKMQQFLLNRTNDSDIHGEVHKALCRPKLTAVPGLNASSAIAVASRSVVVLMNKYGSNVIRCKEIKELLMKCAWLFFSIYGNAIPTDDTNRSAKIRTLLNEASIDLLSALSFFSFGKTDVMLPIVVLNCLDIWQDKDEQYRVISIYEDQLSKLNVENLHQKTIDRITGVVNTYLEGDTPMREFSKYDDVVYQYRKGFGFLLVDNIKLDSDGLSYDCHGSWFDVKFTIRFGGMKYKGYKEL